MNGDELNSTSFSTPSWLLFTPGIRSEFLTVESDLWLSVNSEADGDRCDVVSSMFMSITRFRFACDTGSKFLTTALQILRPNIFSTRELFRLHTLFTK